MTQTTAQPRPAPARKAGLARSIWARPGLWDELEARAEVEGVSRSELIRGVLEDFIAGKLERAGQGDDRPADRLDGVDGREIAERLDGVQMTLDILGGRLENGHGASALPLVDDKSLSFFLLSRLLFIAAYDFVEIGDRLREDPALNARVKTTADQFLQSLDVKPERRP